MSSVNKVILVGRLGADPDLKYTPSNKAVCSLSIATSERWKDKDGQKQEKTEWHRVNVWGDQAENCDKFLAKGRLVYIEGKLTTRSWEDKQTGQKRYATEVVASHVVFLGGGEKDGASGGGGKHREEHAGGGRGRQGWGEGGGYQDPGPSGGPPEDDDIPF